jgi:hypothetical protein
MSKDKYDTEEYVIDEDKFYRTSSLRQCTELFNEDSHIPHQVISVKRVEFSKTEDWEIKADQKAVMILKGVRFTAKEKKFLRTVDGIKFVIEGYKSGWNNVSEFKRNIKSYI